MALGESHLGLVCCWPGKDGTAWYIDATSVDHGIYSTSLHSHFHPLTERTFSQFVQHDNNLPPIISALGLWNSTTTFLGERESVYPLPPTRRVTDPARFFHSTYLVNFLGNVALERLTCTINGPTLDQQQHQGVFHQANVLGGHLNFTGAQSGKKQTFVRVRANDAPIPIPSCSSGPGSTCPLDQFTQYVNGPRKEVAGDFVQRCGLEGVKGATSVTSFFTTKGDGETMLIGIEGTPMGPAVV